MKSDLGNKLYKELSANNSKVKYVMIICFAAVLASFAFAFMVYKQSLNRTYLIDSKGDLVPISLLPTKEDEKIQAKANLDLFVNYYFNLEGATMKSQQEKLLWLVGEQPTKIIKDRIKRGYFADFLSFTELRQRAYILQNTLQITDNAPYTAQFVVRIERQNKNTIEVYNNKVSVYMEKVNKNYPYNPYGFLITKMREELMKGSDDKKVIEQEDKEHVKATEQINYE